MPHLIVTNLAHLPGEAPPADVVCDLFTMRTLWFQTLYVIFVSSHGRRGVMHLNVTARPKADWAWQRPIEATPCDRPLLCSPTQLYAQGVSTDLGIPLSVLDLSLVVEGSTPADALRNSLDLAPRLEHLGFHRYWVAEHHNSPGIASSAPAVLLAHLASATSTIRVGSGGVMLPNHSPLVIAEQFGMLEALHPGRVDLGIGRAPGTDQLTAYALRRGRSGVEDFPEQLVELLGYFDGEWSNKHPFREIVATPALGYRPALWMLGSSTYGAEVAGALGLPYSFAHHFASENTMAAVRTYREAFRPSDALDAPYLMLGVSLVCAETDDRAAWLAAPGRLSFGRSRTGRRGRFPTPEEAETYEYSPRERALLESRASSQILGAPETILDGLVALVEKTGADELIITTAVHAHADRIRSFELVADAVSMSARSP